MADITFKEYLEGRSKEESMKNRQRLLDDFKEFKRRQKVKEQKTMAKAGKMIKKMLTGGQSKIAAKAPPTNKIDAKDFAVLRAEKAKGRGKGLQDEKMKPGKVMKADKGGMGEATKYKKYLKGLKDVKDKTDLKKSKFIQRRMQLGGARALKAAKATRIGKIAAGVAGAALLGKAALEKMYEKKTGKKPLTKRPDKKMGGGMMMQRRPMMAKKGKAVMILIGMKPKKKMGGGMMMRRPMMASEGKMTTKDKTLTYPLAQSMKNKDRLTSRDIKFAEKLVGSKNEKAALTKSEMQVQKGRDKAKKVLGKIKNFKNQATGFVKEIGGFKKGKMMMGGGLTEATQRLRAQGKMAGGMMQRPMMAMGGGMMPGYKKGKSVMAKGCKLGRKKPTKMYT